MRGHWLSGTRKLNKHYQSGEGVGYKTYTYTGMSFDLLGFDYHSSSEWYGPNMTGGFETASSDNVQVAPLYKIGSSMPTVATEDTGYLVYDTLIINNGTISTTNSAIRGSYPIWKYGEFRGDPYWCYTNDMMGWNQSLHDNTQVNQDGVAYSSTRNGLYWQNQYSGQYAFENFYADVTLKVVVPVIEIIAVPEVGQMVYHPNILMTDEELPISFSGEIKLRTTGSRPNRTEFSDNGVGISWNAGGVGTIYSDNNGVYVDCGRGIQLGAFSVPVDKVYRACKVNGSFTVAGTSGSYNMIYAARLVRLEIEDVNPVNKLLVL